MKVYFTTSARASKEIKKNCELIFNKLKQMGHEHLDDYKINTDPTKFYSSTDGYKLKVFENTNNIIKQSDLVILEVSTHSLTMGYLIKYSLDIKIPIIALHVRQHNPGFIIGIENENFQLIEYNPNNLEKVLEDAIEFANHKSDTRFNMMLSPKLSSYLNEESEKEGVSKATFIRKLIKQHRVGSPTKQLS